MNNIILSTVMRAAKLYSNDVFATTLYTGNGAARTIVNGIDLAEFGGLVWTKSRSSSEWHHLIDTARSNTKALNSNDDGTGFTGPTYITGFNSNGYSLGSSTGMNGSGTLYAAWTFLKAAKFFDVVTYTGNGLAGRQIPHSLGIAPGLLVVKKTSATGDWWVQHNSLDTADGQYLKLNTSDPRDESIGPWANTMANNTGFTVGATNNASGTTYVAYLWAHDPSAEGVIQCGQVTTDASGNATVTLGWEPQFLLLKNVQRNRDWFMFDTKRGMVPGGNAQFLLANASAAETFTSSLSRTSTGFNLVNEFASNSNIYMAIRAPNKPA